MGKTTAGPVNQGRLKSFVERIEKLREEKKAIGSDEREVFSEAKGVGFDAKAMREVLKRRAMDAGDRDEWDMLVDTYEHALGLRGEAARIVSSGGTYDEAAEATGLSRATVARSVASIKNSENETKEVARHAPETGSATVVATGNLDALSPALGSTDGSERLDEACSTAPPPTKPEIGAAAKPEAERVASTINPDEDDLKIPLSLTKAGQRASAPSKEK